MTGIDPTTCKPGDVYRVKNGGREFVGERIDSDNLPWILNRPACAWVPDSAITVLHRLVPESDDVVDAEVEEDWTILRKAADAILHSGYDPTTLTTVLDVADYLTGQAGRIEADHRAAQEKAAQDAAREALIEKAALAVGHLDGWGPLLQPVDIGRTLADAGLLAEAGEDRG